MEYIKAKWIHDLKNEPIFYYMEVDPEGYEKRKIVLYEDEKVEYASEEVEKGAFLSPVPVGTVEEIDSDPECEAERISHKEFNEMWSMKVGSMWINFLDNPLPISKLYNNNIPSLDRVRIVKLSSINKNALNIIIQFNKLPEPLPPRWKLNNYNQAFMGIILYNVSEFELDGWNSMNTSKVTFSNCSDGKLSLEITSKTFEVRCKFDCVNISRTWGDKV
ncbi:DUF6881 domain-containing protein [Marininema halotolerans]|uniref:Immunity protein 50 n=1 Tax=Marininema halotolerans TaxID=1155944 RepID=A0A1I6UMD0_9BACL|nr:Imm50 family immunity protein [Marininema halotolerans]SFT02600.1 Immunity protein 50 [Marininema halotolerans]